jgi:hypothetical protein
MMQMFHCGRNLPPLVKRNQWRNRTAGLHEDLAHLQCTQIKRAKTNTDLECTIAHKVESQCGNAATQFNERVGRRRRNIECGSQAGVA